MLNKKEIKLKIIVESNTEKALASAIKRVTKVLSSLSSVKHKIFYLPNSHKKFTFLRSPHIDKKSKEQIALSFYRGVIELENFNLSDLFKLNVINRTFDLAKLKIVVSSTY